MSVAIPGSGPSFDGLSTSDLKEISSELNQKRSAVRLQLDAPDLSDHRKHELYLQMFDLSADITTVVQEKIKRKDAENCALRQELRRRDSLDRGAQRIISVLRADIEGLQGTVNDLRDDLAASAEEQSRLLAENRGLQRNVVDLTQENQTLQARVRELEAEKAKAKHRASLDAWGIPIQRDGIIF